MKRALALILSLIIMAVIFSRIDLSRLGNTAASADPWMLLGAILMFLPQIYLTSLRWQVMTRPYVALGTGESVSLILSSNALNILLPARMGDLAKAYFLNKSSSLTLRRGTNLVIFEKYLDLAALSQVLLLGVLLEWRLDELAVSGLLVASFVLGLFPVMWISDIRKLLRYMHRRIPIKLISKIGRFLQDGHDYVQETKKDILRLLAVIALSAAVWISHFIQFYFIFRALGSDVGVLLILSRVPLALYVGLIPVTLAGIGTRDAALLFLFSGVVPDEIIVGVGLFASIRYFVPGILGLPFLNRQITSDREILEQAREQKL